MSGSFTHAGRTVGAVLRFNAAGELIDFVSDDRSRASADGTSFTKMRWSTPVRDYRAFGAHRVASRGEGRRHASDGEFAYIQLDLLEVDDNVEP